MGTVIYKYAKFLGEEGDLSRQMALEDPNLSEDEKNLVLKLPDR